MSKYRFRSISIAAALLVPFTCAFAAQPLSHSTIVAVTGNAATPASSTTLAITGFPPPPVPPPSHELAITGFPPPPVPPPSHLA